MGDIYRQIAEYYDELFPLNPEAINFINGISDEYITERAGDFSKNPEEKIHILDVGSATGKIPVVLSGNPKYKLTAIEPDEKMVTVANRRINAREKTEGKEFVPIDFIQAGMLDLDAIFKNEMFDLILCVGNTLVHLQTPEDIGKFFKLVSGKLKPNGRFIIQIVNYTRVLTQHIWELPFIDTPNVSFARKYEFIQNDENSKLPDGKTNPASLPGNVKLQGESAEPRKVRKIRFYTRLTLKKTGEFIDNRIFLYPLEIQEIKSLANQNGLEPIGTFGNYNSESWSPESPASIMVLKRI